MRLSAPVRGAIYGLALVVAVPLAWTGGQSKGALLLGGVAVFGMLLELVAVRRR
jgi:hypothetical protein